MPFEKGTEAWKQRKNPGRKGFGLEYQKKRVLDQAYHTVKKSMLKDSKELKEKEKIELAKQVVLKEMGSKVDLTSGGDKLQIQVINYNEDNSTT